MSRENVEVVRRLVAAVQAADLEAAIATLCCPMAGASPRRPARRSDLPLPGQGVTPALSAARQQAAHRRRRRSSSRPGVWGDAQRTLANREATGAVGSRSARSGARTRRSAVEFIASASTSAAERGRTQAITSSPAPGPRDHRPLLGAAPRRNRSAQCRTMPPRVGPSRPSALRVPRSAVLPPQHRPV